MAILSKEAAKFVADSVEEYVNLLELCIIINGPSAETFQNSIKHVRKTIKKIRKGKEEDVFDLEVLAEYRDMFESAAARKQAGDSFG